MEPWSPPWRDMETKTAVKRGTGMARRLSNWRTHTMNRRVFPVDTAVAMGCRLPFDWLRRHERRRSTSACGVEYIDPRRNGKA
jgi:hypothetical protein